MDGARARCTGLGEYEENRRAEVNVLREVHCHEDEGRRSEGSVQQAATKDERAGNGVAKGDS